jgi:hypothetical protein
MFNNTSYADHGVEEGPLYFDVFAYSFLLGSGCLGNLVIIYIFSRGRASRKASK